MVQWPRKYIWRGAPHLWKEPLWERIQTFFRVFIVFKYYHSGAFGQGNSVCGPTMGSDPIPPL